MFFGCDYHVIDKSECKLKLDGEMTDLEGVESPVSRSDDSAPARTEHHHPKVLVMTSPPRQSILLPTPSGPQPGITPQPSLGVSTSQTPSQEPESSISTNGKPKARLAEPEIVYLPSDPVPYAASDDESDDGDDGEEGEVLGEDGLPKARGMLRNLADETDVCYSRPLRSLI